MENCTNGSGNCSAVEAQGGVSNFVAFGVLITVMGTLTFVLNTPIIIALCMTRGVVKALRVFLISTLLSGLLISGTMIASSLIAFVDVFFATPDPPLLLCRFILWVHNISAVARSLSVMGFSIMVLIVVRYGKKTIRPIYIVLPIAIIWGLSLLLTIQYQVPQVYATRYIGGSVCLPVQDDTIIFEARLFFTVFVLIIASWLPLVVCIVVPIIVLCYIKERSITADNEYSKAVAKLGLFLIAGNFINAAGLTIISILTYVTSAGGAELIYCIYAIVLLSVYPAPILIVTFLKPVRAKMKTFLTCLICCYASKLSMKSEGSASTADTAV